MKIMNEMVILTTICCIISLINISRTVSDVCPQNKEKDWSYEPSFPNGPSHWGEKYPGCNGKSQSPIKIVTSQLTPGKGHQRLKLSGYDRPVSKVMIENTGYTIQVTPRDGIERSLEVDNEKYNLEAIHFHWGNNDARGSEHQFDNHKYALEAHFLHRNERREEAVVAVFFREHYKANAALGNILFERGSFEYEGEAFEGTIRKTSLNPHKRGKIYLEDIIENRCSYYRYNGSLTTPPCTENVKWLLSKTSKRVTIDQLHELFSLYSVRRGTANEGKCHLVNNYRPIQALNGRKVYE